MHLLIAAALMLATDPLCADIAKLAEAAKEPAPFASLRAADFAPGFFPKRYCQANGQTYRCFKTLLPPEITHETVAARIAACLGDAKISVDREWPGVSRRTVRGSGLRFELEESGSDTAHVGRMLSIEIRADR